MKENIHYILVCQFYNQFKKISKGSNFMTSHQKESLVFVWAIFVNEFYIPNQMFWNNIYLYEYKGHRPNILFK